MGFRSILSPRCVRGGAGSKKIEQNGVLRNATYKNFSCGWQYVAVRNREIQIKEIIILTITCGE
jgi:hypothetical protein